MVLNFFLFPIYASNHATLQVFDNCVNTNVSLRQRRPFLVFEFNEICYGIIQMKPTCSSGTHFCPGSRPFWSWLERRLDFGFNIMRLSIQTCKKAKCFFVNDIFSLIISYLEDISFLVLVSTFLSPLNLFIF